MGRSPCCEKVGLKKGPWTPEEDQKLLAYIEEHGHGSWRALPAKAGLERCGKSCRLRWTNYLRPDIKRGKFSMQEEQTIIQLHALLGNRWSAIATHLPKRTDNEIKNYWNTHLKKRLAKMGIDPVTHKPKSDAHALGSGQAHSKIAANLSHMAQWESARLEAEARLVRESKLRSGPLDPAPLFAPKPAAVPPMPPPPPCLDILRAWHGLGSKPPGAGGIDLESPTSTLSFCAENRMAVASLAPAAGDNGHPAGDEELEGCEEEEWKCFERAAARAPERMDGLGLFSVDVGIGGAFGAETAAWLQEASGAGGGFTSMQLHSNRASEQNFLEGCGESENVEGGSSVEEEQRDYWNTILDLVNASPPSNSPPVF